MGKNKKVKKNRKVLGFNKRLLTTAIVTVLVTSMALFSGVIPSLYKISVMSIPDHDPFDGTTYPLKKVPNWVNLTSGKWSQEYGQFSSKDLTNLPAYDPDQLEMLSSDLKYGNATDDRIRNAKITYSVVYMGNYKLDGKENSGSHLAVDIKVPMKTPVYAIANGTIIKASMQNDGFGHHIVLQHNDFPSLSNKNGKETLFSSYSHLSSLVVSDREVVKKGQLIGYTGATGTATTPHLHFQIDNNDAPWHPFWPFTWKEVRDAGLDFFSAVNAGLGEENALATTINPLKYVQKYMGDDAMYIYDGDSEENANNEEDADEQENDEEDSNNVDSYVEEEESDNADDAESSEDSNEDENDEDENSEGENVEETGDESDNAPAEFSSFQINVDSNYYIDSKAEFTISIKDQYGHNFKDGFFGDITVTSDKGFFTPNKTILTSLQFVPNGEYVGTFDRMESGRDRIELVYKDEKYYSDRFDIKEETATVSFEDVPLNSKYRDSIMYLASKGVVKGYSDGTFKPTKKVTRAEAVKLILEGNDTSLSSGNLNFLM